MYPFLLNALFVATFAVGRASDSSILGLTGNLDKGICLYHVSG